MAFSTQKDFLHVAFMNERPEAKCIPMDGVRLKTYASTTDQRAWSMSKDRQAQYLIDLVACRTYPHEGSGAGDGNVLEAPKASMRSGKISEPNENTNKPDVSRHTIDSDISLSPAIGDDSLIHAAIEKMTIFEDLLAEKENLKSQLEVSEEKLKVFKEEKYKIDAILNDEHYPEMSSVLEEKIDQLRSSSKIDKYDENELLKILEALCSQEKAYKVLDAQNSYLRRLVDKLSQRSRLANVNVKSEKSTDINYLQSELNNLRKEVSLLRSVEDDQLQRDIEAAATLSDRDADNVAKIMAERNALREKCQHFAALEGKIVQWKRDAEQVQSLHCALRKKDEEIEDCHEEIEDLHYKLERMDKCLKGKEQTHCMSIEYLKEENQRMQEEICRCKYDLKQVTQLQGQVQCLCNELCEKNAIIEEYDMQFQQLLGVVEGLQKNGSVDIRSLQDVDSQTHNEHIEELTATTRATLDQISKELETRQVLEADLAQSKIELETFRRESQEKMAMASAELNAKELENSELKKSLQKTALAVRQSYSQLNLETRQDENCEDQVERLESLIIELKSQRESEKESFEKASTELQGELEAKQKQLQNEIDDLKESLTIVENEKRQLKTHNEDLSTALVECQDKVKAQKDQLSKLDIKAISLETELRSSKADLKEAGKLVKDISSVQDRNENLKSVLEAADHSELFKQEIANLKKQLGEEKTKNGYIAEQNKQLQSALEEAKNVIRSQKVAATRTKEAPGLKKPKSNRADTGAADSQPLAEGKDSDGPGTDAITPNGNETDAIGKSATKPTGVSSKQGKPLEKKNNAKLAHLQKIHEAERNAERKKYEKEIDGHRLSNEVLRKSLTKFTTQMQSKSAVDFEREFRTILDNFIHETSRWRCEKNCQKQTKLQNICKKILEIGIDHLTYKELLYLHQQISEAALKLRPSVLNTGRELKCCKCSGDICYAPTIPRENEKILLEKLAILERDIQSARDNLRKIKEEQDTYSNSDTDQMELETIRAHTYRLNNEIRNSSGRTRSSRYYAIQEEFELPTKDKWGP